MLGERLKKAIELSGKDRLEVASFIGISEGNLYKLFKKDSFEWEYIKKASQITGLELSFFIEAESLSPDYKRKSSDGGAFGEQILQALSGKVENIEKIFEDQLRKKDEQIAGMQRTIDVLLGKSNGGPHSLNGAQTGTVRPLYYKATDQEEKVA